MERAALSLAASVVSPIFSMLGSKAAPCFGGDITEEELQHLQNIILPKFRTVLRLAEAVPVNELKPWLRTLQAAAYEAEDVLDMYEYKRLEAEVSSIPDPLKKLKKKVKDFISPLSLKTELKKSMEKLRQSADEADKLVSLCGTFSQTPLLRDTMQQQLPTVSSTSSPVFGRDKECEYLVNMLISTTNELIISEMSTPIIAICGIGGAGKTTLAQRVYNDSRVEKHFDMRIWVHVSRKFDAHRVTTEIIESATKGESSNGITSSLDALQTRLKEILKSKKFLVVFDDVWCQDCMQWDQMLVPLNEVGDTKSRILITTRTQEVASRLGIESVVALKDLEADDCMSIFKHYSLGDANKVIHDPELAIIAEQIMMKLKKSPLSARILGSLLRGKKNVADWRQILNKDEMLKDTLDALYLSFENLAPHLQHCFAFCSLYPEGYHFYWWEIQRLVRFWIAQGFIEAPYNGNMTIEDKGMQYFNELLSHSFFQKEMYSSGEDYYVIHDLLHELAEGVSKDHCLRIEDDSLHIPPTVMHLSIYFTKDLSLHIPHIFKLLNLRTFMIIDDISEVDFNCIFDARSKIFDKLKKLRVLDLGDQELPELHKSVDQLKHLRYFHLNGVDQLPESLGKLYHLQFLKLGTPWLIKKVPKNLNNLISMRFLDGEIISKIPLFGRLTSLQNIEEYSASSKAGHGVGQFKNLRELRGSLHIDNLENVQNKADASEALLNEKKLLEKLCLEWTYSPERDGRIDKEVIDGLEPSPNLNELELDGYNGIELPKWLLNDEGAPQFSRLSKLSVKNCPKLEQVPSLPGTLKTVVIERCKNLCEASSLPRDLRVVTIRDCPKLTQLCPFPRNLEELHIRECPGVETLLSDILLFESKDEQPNHQQQQQEKDDRQQLQLRTLSIDSCSTPGKKRHFGCWNKPFASLSKLKLRNLPWLASLLLLLLLDHNVTSLERVHIENCENLESFGSSLASVSSLLQLDISDCPRLTMQNLRSDMDGSFLLPSSLKELHFHNCGDREINLLERCLIGLTSLTMLDIRGYSHARSLPELANPGSIEYLWVSDCPELASIWNLQRFASLKELGVIRCPKVVVEGGEPPPSLKALTVDDISVFSALLCRSRCLNSLSKLTILHNCTEDIGFTRVQGEDQLFPHLSSLTRLDIWHCPNLTSLPANLEKLSPLRELTIEGCPKIESLPNLPASLEYLSTLGCHPHLKVSYGEGGPLHHKVRHIRYLSIRS